MAEAQNSIFNAKATEKLRSPDDLDRYVRLTNPSVWAVLAACAVLLAGLLAWGVFGAVSTNVAATSVVVDGRAMCFLAANDSARVHEGDVANVGGEQMIVASVSATPLSREEAHQVLGSDYLAATLFADDWAYQIVFDGDGKGLAEGVPLSTNITTERVAPISLLWGE